tara:strand:+ start:2051 stop:3145 length:1095 start_codon:yes stop_codon:yes gene_type:complete
MSKINMISRTKDLAKQVLGTNRAGPNQQMMGRNIPGRGAGIVSAYKSLDPVEKLALGGLGMAGVGSTTAVIALSQIEPEELGAEIANMKLGLDEGLEMLRQKAADFTEVPQVYFLKLEQGYKDEMRKQQEMKNIEETGTPMPAPLEIPPTIEEQALKPVSIFMAGGDEVVRFEDRPPSMQIFSLQTSIDNLMTEYEMAVRNKEFARAQKIADEIDQIEQQKIAINSKMVGMKDGDEVKKNNGFPDLSGDGKITRKDILIGQGVEFAEGGEAIDDDLESMQMSEEDAMNQMNQLTQSPEVQMIEQLIGVVQQLIAQGVSEEEIKMFLKEQGLDDEDIESLFEMIAESGMQQEQGANIDQQLQSIM